MAVMKKPGDTILMRMFVSNVDPGRPDTLPVTVTSIGWRATKSTTDDNGKVEISYIGNLTVEPVNSLPQTLAGGDEDVPFECQVKIQGDFREADCRVDLLMTPFLLWEYENTNGTHKATVGPVARTDPLKLHVLPSNLRVRSYEPKATISGTFLEVVEGQELALTIVVENRDDLAPPAPITVESVRWVLNHPDLGSVLGGERVKNLFVTETDTPTPFEIPAGPDSSVIKTRLKVEFGVPDTIKNQALTLTPDIRFKILPDTVERQATIKTLPFLFPLRLVVKLQ